MDVLAGIAALALVGVYLYSRRSRRTPPGPLAATLTPLAEFSPDALKNAAESHRRKPAQGYLTKLDDGLSVGFGYTPGHDRVDVFAPTDAGETAFASFEFSLASRRWLTEPPLGAEQIKTILRDTFPG